MDAQQSEWTLRNLFGADDDTIEAILNVPFPCATDHTLNVRVTYNSGTFTVTAI
jgi:hypothetical protein